MSPSDVLSLRDRLPARGRHARVVAPPELDPRGKSMDSWRAGRHIYALALETIASAATRACERPSCSVRPADARRFESPCRPPPERRMSPCSASAGASRAERGAGRHACTSPESTAHAARLRSRPSRCVELALHSQARGSLGSARFRRETSFHKRGRAVALALAGVARRARVGADDRGDRATRSRAAVLWRACARAEVTRSFSFQRGAHSPSQPFRLRLAGRAARAMHSRSRVYN
jgi:hypothetical protein